MASENGFSEEFVTLINYIFSRQLAYMCSQSAHHSLIIALVMEEEEEGIGSQTVTHHKATSVFFVFFQ